jgi:hypothetical protein
VKRPGKDKLEDLAWIVLDLLGGKKHPEGWRQGDLTVAVTHGMVRVQIGQNPTTMRADLVGSEIDDVFLQLIAAVGWNHGGKALPVPNIGILQMGQGRKAVVQVNMWGATSRLYSHARAELKVPTAQQLATWLAPKIGWDLQDVA